MFWLKLRQCINNEGSILPQFLTSCRPISQVDKIIAKNVNRAFFKCLQKINDARSPLLVMTRTIKNPHNGIRAQMVLKLTNKLQMAEIETDSRIDIWK